MGGPYGGRPGAHSPRPWATTLVVLHIFDGVIDDIVEARTGRCDASTQAQQSSSLGSGVWCSSQTLRPSRAIRFLLSLLEIIVTTRRVEETASDIIK